MEDFLSKNRAEAIAVSIYEYDVKKERELALMYAPEYDSEKIYKALY